MNEQTVRFSAAEMSHLAELLRSNAEEGVYYGNRDQYWKRHARLLEKLAPHATPTEEEG